MYQKQQYRAYANATQTVAKTRQIIMLYDAAIRNLQQARDAMEEKRVEDRYNLLTKAGEIIYGLQGCLDFENGGEVARVLYDFYAAADARILLLHRNQDLRVCDQLITDLKAMRDTWEEIDRNDASEAAAPPVSANDGAASMPLAGATPGAAGLAISA